MKVLAIDASTKSTGVALFEDSKLVKYACLTASSTDLIKRIQKIIEQLKKTGETPFVFELLTVDADENLFLPIQSLNEIRREALTKLSETIAAAYERERPAPKNKEQKEDTFSTTMT